MSVTYEPDSTDLWWQEIIGRIAYETHRKPKFATCVSSQEIQGALWEWYLKASKPRTPTRNNPEGLSRIARYRRDNDDDDFEGLVATILRDEAVLYARRERAAQLGYSVEDEFFYSKPALESLVEAALDHESWVYAPREGEKTRSSGAASEGGNWLATLADVSRALSKLPKDDQNLLDVAFRHGGLSRADIARGLNITRRGVDHRIEAALKRLWHLLGGPRWAREDSDDEEYVGSREVMSNAQARALTESQYA